MHPNIGYSMSDRSSFRYKGSIRTTRSSFTESDAMEKSRRERNEQMAAQIAVLSCDITLHAIKQGMHNYIINTRKRPKTKYEYNQERKRDFRMNKEENEAVDYMTIFFAPETEPVGRVSYGQLVLATDPVPFVRNYKYEIFDSTLKLLHRKHAHYKYIQKLDLANLLVGDAKMQPLCDGIAKSKLTALNLSSNGISDTGIKYLAAILRSMHELRELNLSHNRFTDEASALLFHDDCYSPTLQQLDLSYNMLGPLFAFRLGGMFAEDRAGRAALHSLLLGGRVHSKGWGDEFIKVLTCALVAGGQLCRLKKLCMPDAGLSGGGADCITTLLLCDDVALEEVNLSRNALNSWRSKTNLLNALRRNSTLKMFYAREAGWTELDATRALAALPPPSLHSQTAPDKHPHSSAHFSWDELLALGYCAAFTLNKCRNAWHAIKLTQEVGQTWKLARPPVWQVLRAKYDLDLLALFSSERHLNVELLNEGMLDTLETINEQLRHVELLREAAVLSRIMTVDPRSVQGLSGKAQQQVAQEVAPVQRAISEADLAQVRLERLSAHSREELFSALEAYLRSTFGKRAVLQEEQAWRKGTGGSKHHKKKKKQGVRRSVLTGAAKYGAMRGKAELVEALQMAVEDCSAAVLAHGRALQRLVGGFYEQKMLYFCILQDQTSGLGGPGRLMDFAKLMRRTVPYHAALGGGGAAAFSHYFYLTFAKERSEHQKQEERALQLRMKQLNQSSSTRAAAFGSASIRSAKGGAGGGCADGTAAEVGAVLAISHSEDEAEGSERRGSDDSSSDGDGDGSSALKPSEMLQARDKKTATALPSHAVHLQLGPGAGPGEIAPKKKKIKWKDRYRSASATSASANSPAVVAENGHVSIPAAANACGGGGGGGGGSGATSLHQGRNGSRIERSRGAFVGGARAGAGAGLLLPPVPPAGRPSPSCAQQTQTQAAKRSTSFFAKLFLPKIT